MTQNTIIHLAAAAGIAALAVAWLALAPPQLGGSTSYALIVGSSMEPHLHRGDLAVLRPLSDYGPGDAVAYRSRDLGRVVLHRIVRLQDGRYVFKGDNNDFLDPTRPSRDDLVGRLWFRVPKVGAVLAAIRAPHVAALLTALGVLVLGGGAGAGRRAPQARARIAAVLSGRRRERALLALVGTACAFVLLAIAAFAAPATRTALAPGLWRHAGAFSYGATTAPSAVYPDGRVRSGDPVFLRLVRTLTLGFRYRLDSGTFQPRAGRARLVVEVSGDDGWHRSLPLTAPRRFDGRKIALGGRLDVRALGALVERVAALTGTHSAGYAVDVVARVDVDGTLDGQPVSETFAPRLGFRLDPVELRPTAAAAAGFARSASGKATRRVPNTLTLGPVSLDVRAARALALAGAALTLGAALAAGLALRERRPDEAEDEAGRIRARFGDWIVDGHVKSAGDVEVATIEELVRLAEHFGRPIVHEERKGAHAYALHVEGAVYRFGDPPPRPRRSAPKTEAPANGKPAAR